MVCHQYEHTGKRQAITPLLRKCLLRWQGQSRVVTERKQVVVGNRPYQAPGCLIFTTTLFYIAIKKLDHGRADVLEFGFDYDRNFVANQLSWNAEIAGMAGA